MRIAVIDCGTNTFNLLVVDLKKTSFESVHSSKIPVKLGEGGINNSYINAMPFQRGVDALISFKKQINSLNVSQTHAYATSAIRDAKNGIEFKDKVFKESGINLNIIDGNKEADLIYKGNKLAVHLTNSPSLIMDIGGGSTEFIIGNDKEIFWKKSYRLGAARLLEKFKPSDPIISDEINQINTYLLEQLSELTEAVQKYKPCELIGSSGAFDSVVEMIQSELNGEPFIKTKTEYIVENKDYYHISENVIVSTLQQRRNMKGLVEMRVDMIVVSCLLINFVLKNCRINNMRVSTYSLKEGALQEIMQNNNVSE